MKENSILSKVGAYFKYAWKELLIILLIAVFDLVSKNIVQSTMELGQTVTIIPGLFYFTYVQNTRAAYSMSFGLEKVFGESGVITFFIIMTIVAIIVFAFFLVFLRRRMFLLRLALGMIIGGAFGNLVDRILLKAVRDFIRLDFFGISPFGCFNIADMALVFGVILFIVYVLFFYEKDDKRLKALASAENESIENNAENEKNSAITSETAPYGEEDKDVDKKSDKEATDGGD